MLKRVLILIFIFLSFHNISTASKTDSLLKVISLTKEDTTRINCWNRLSYICSDDDSAKTKLYATYALQLAQKTGYTKGISEAWSNLAYYHETHKFDFSTAEKYYLAGIQIARKENDLSLEGSGLMDYASVLKKQKKHQQVLEINKKVVEIFSKLQDTAKLILAYNNLGNAYKNVNQFEKSIEALLKSLDFAKMGKNQNQIARAYINIGVCYDGNGDYDLAISNYLAAIEPAASGGNKNYIASNYGNIGAAYINLNQFEKAITYMEKAMAIHESQNDIRDVAFVLNNLATANNSLKKYEEAIKNSQRCIELSRQVKDIELEAYAYLFLGVSYQGLKNYKLAETNFLLAKQQIESVNNTAYTMQVYAKIADFYAEKKDYENAFNYYHKLTTIRDTIFNAEKHLQIATLQTQYQTAEKERAWAEVCAENLQKNLQIQKKNNLLVISTFGLIALLSVSILIWRNAALRRTKLLQEKELSEAKAKHQLQDEKLRISRELHDNIGAQLTFINSSLQNLSANNDEEMEQTKTMTLNTIRELRSIVWLINKEEFYVDELVIKLRDLMKPLQNRKPKIEITSLGNEELKLNSNIASNVFRIIQEATNNTIKYAQANVLTITVDAVNKDVLKIKIQDDGIGFDTQKVQYSFGLKNMESRVKSLNGQFELKSVPGNGTTLNLEIPIV